MRRVDGEMERKETRVRRGFCTFADGVNSIDAKKRVVLHWVGSDDGIEFYQYWQASPTL